MSIQITIRAPGLNISASLKDDSLAGLIQLVQENREDTIAQVEAPASTDKLAVPLPGHDSEETAKNLLRGFGAAELLNRVKWDTYPEKILLLGAWHESRDGVTPWRSSDMDETFKQAKEKPPNNCPRDIKTAIKSGLIHAETPRTYVVTRTGWNKVGQVLHLLES